MKMRPLDLPSWTDKLVGEVVRLLLEAYYEPRFSPRSHGFRPGRGCHTALTEVANHWSGTTWFIEGDIADCFGSFDHDVMLSILGEHLHDNRFLRLVRSMLRAGYLEDWEYHATLSGCPQGGVASPVMSNIYLDRRDKFVGTVLIPEYTRGKGRAENPAYKQVSDRIVRARRRYDPSEVRRLRQQLRTLTRGEPDDPGFRRLRYTRYADDHLLGFIGPKVEAEAIKTRLARFLRDDLKLDLTPDQTLITHGPRVCFQASVERPGRPPLVTRFGGIPLKRQKKAVLDDRQPAPVTGRRAGSELLARLRRSRCELCEQRSDVQVHQVSKLTDLV